MAATEIYTNNATTTVSSGGTTATSGSQIWTVASSATFPTAATGSTQFHVGDPAAPSELIAVTNVSSTTWTVTRGAESTTPVAHAQGFTVASVITAGGLNGLLSGASGPLAVTSGGTGGTAVTSYAVVTGGTSSSTALQTVSGVGSGGQVLTSQGAGALPQWAAVGTAASVSGTVAILNGGTGQATATAAYNALSPMTTTGDMEYESANSVASRLAGNTSSTKNFLLSTGSGGTATAPAWGTIATADVPVLNQNTTGTASNITDTLDQVPAPAANVSLNSHKITSLANGAATTDGAAFGQIPVVSQSNGLLAWNCDLNAVGGTGVLAGAGVVYLLGLWLPNAITISNIWWYNSTVGAGPTAGECQVGIYSSTGAVGGTSTTAAAGTGIAVSGAAEVALLSPYSAPAGLCWVGMVFQAGTLPTILRCNTSTNSIVNLGRTAATYRMATNGAGVTTGLPGSITPSSNSVTSSVNFWVGVS